MAKKELMDQQRDRDLIDFLEQLLEQDELKGAVKGIAKQVVARGVKSMTENQKNAIDDFIANYKDKHKCEVCSNGNAWALADYIFIAENGLCPMCEYDREKFMQA